MLEIGSKTENGTSIIVHCEVSKKIWNLKIRPFFWKCIPISPINDLENLHIF